MNTYWPLRYKKLNNYTNNMPMLMYYHVYMLHWPDMSVVYTPCNRYNNSHPMHRAHLHYLDNWTDKSCGCYYLYSNTHFHTPHTTTPTDSIPPNMNMTKNHTTNYHN